MRPYGSGSTCAALARATGSSAGCATAGRVLQLEQLLSMMSHARTMSGIIQGWFVAGGILCFLFKSISHSSIAEIGIHHGKSFIAMLDCAPEFRKALAIDVFEDQEKTTTNQELEISCNSRHICVTKNLRIGC